MLIRATCSEDLSIGPNQRDADEQGEPLQYWNISYLYILQILKNIIDNARVRLNFKYARTTGNPLSKRPNPSNATTGVIPNGLKNLEKMPHSWL
ncbi:hypothetical protein EE612_005863 [Oryza sativa]|nr:hypothetical protein EE612_005863 [Oryza sativa]